MFRNAQGLLGTGNLFRSCYLCVRWRRKPSWLPVAKSKIFRVPERCVIPKEESEEIRRLKNSYNTQMKAIRWYLHLEVETATVKGNLSRAQSPTEEKYDSLCILVNDEWNAQVAKIREERLHREAELKKEVILQRLIDHEQKEKAMRETVEQIVKAEKERAHTYITADNINETIEAVLASEVDHNFSMDVEGNLYHGRRKTPKVLEEERKLTGVTKAG